jgi:hypothetical protein
MRPKTTLITFLSFINKGLQRPELIELIEQEGATRFFVKIWKLFGAFWDGTSHNRGNFRLATQEGAGKGTADVLKLASTQPCRPSPKSRSGN